MNAEKTKIQYSIDPNNRKNPISIICNGDIIFSDSGSRNQTFAFAYLLEALAKVANIEVEDILPEWEKPKGTHPDYQSLIKWMEDFSSKNKTQWMGADDPVNLKLGFVCDKNNILVNVCIMGAGPIPDAFQTTTSRQEFCEKLIQMCDN